MTKLRYWLIKKLAGRDLIVLNAKIEGCIKPNFIGQVGCIANSDISWRIYKVTSPKQREDIVVSTKGLRSV